jgi:hypothetical protein
MFVIVFNNNEQQIKHNSKVEEWHICFDGSNYPFIDNIHLDLCSLIEV